MITRRQFIILSGASLVASGVPGLLKRNPIVAENTPDRSNLPAWGIPWCISRDSQEIRVFMPMILTDQESVSQ